MEAEAIDVAIIAAYLAATFALGVGVERRARRDMDSYFLAGRKLPWWLLGISGGSSYFDVTGTMWMVSVFYLLGMRGIWVHWFWCFPIAGFMMAYKAKWAYRSGVLTGMEWLVFRFGDGPAGRAARGVSAIVMTTNFVLMLGYAGTGMGKFLDVFLPFDKSLSVPLLFGFTGLYILFGGFSSVVYTDFFQTILMTAAALYVAVAAFVQIDPAAFRAQAGDDWFSVMPTMHLPRPPKEYPDPFGLLVMLWVTKGTIGLFANSGGVEFQRFRAARSEGDACKVGLAWGLVTAVRWGMVMGFTVFGLSILAKHGATVDSEQVLPLMIDEVFPPGFKGLVIAAMLAAFMSTFDALLNVTASFIVNDLIKPAWPTAGPKALVRASYASTVCVIAIGIAISRYTERIDAIWNPINFALGAALLAPGLFAAYWWRMGGWALCLSAACTLPAALYVKVFTELRELQYFPLLAAISFASCIAGAYAFPPAPREALMDFYRKVRPFGLWRPVQAMLVEAGDDPRRPERDRFDIPVAILATVFFVLFYLLMLDIVLHNWPRAAACAGGAAAIAVALYTVWWRALRTS